MYTLQQRMVNDIKENGYTRIPDFLSPEQARTIEEYMHKFNEENYSQENLLKRVCYKREESNGGRQGDAYMVSSETGVLNSIILEEDIMVRQMFDLYQNTIKELVGKDMNEESRCMLNCQQYFDKSFEVGDHYDGEFFDFEHGDDSYGEQTLIINEGLLPRFVMVLVLRNENEKGTYVRPHDSKDRIDIPNKSYDLIMFDNISMRHGVPMLEKPRMMIGFRNFDYYPYHFERNPEAGRDWIELYDEVNPGWIRSIDQEESIELQKDFLNEWENGLAKEQLKLEAAF